MHMHTRGRTAQNSRAPSCAGALLYCYWRRLRLGCTCGWLPQQAARDVFLERIQTFTYYLRLPPAFEPYPNRGETGVDKPTLRGNFHASGSPSAQAKNFSQTGTRTPSLARAKRCIYPRRRFGFCHPIGAALLHCQVPCPVCLAPRQATNCSRNLPCSTRVFTLLLYIHPASRCGYWFHTSPRP